MHAFQCECGIVRGEIDERGIHNHLICYCEDCRAYARSLGKADAVLDANGGTEIVQLAQPRLRFHQGVERLRALRLSENGLIRWYAGCCNTPIGNTLASPKIAVIGMVHACLDRDRISRDFGAYTAIVNTRNAIGENKPRQRGVIGVIGRAIAIVVRYRFGRRYLESPLFTNDGLPIAEPKVLSAETSRALRDNA